MRIHDSSMIDGIPDILARDWEREREARAQAVAEAVARVLLPSPPPPIRITEPVGEKRTYVDHYSRVEAVGPDGQVRASYKDTIEAASALGVSRGHVRACLFRRAPCAGYRLRWKHREVIATAGGRRRRYPSVSTLAKAIGADKKMVYRAIRIGATCRGLRIDWADELEQEAIAS